MVTISLEDGLELKRLSDDSFESIQRPWTWPRTTVVPGGILMSLAARAAQNTVSDGFSIDTLQAHFLAAPKTKPVQIEVQRLSDGGRFAARSALVQQDGSLKVHVLCAFVRTSAMGGPAMRHVIGRASPQTLNSIMLDDLEPGRNHDGPYMKFQRLPLLYNRPGQVPPSPPPESLVYTSVAQVCPPIETSDSRTHSLGIILISDYHVLDGPPHLHGRTLGWPRINDASRTLQKSDFSFMTSLNHTIRFHVHEGFRADDLCYVEVTSPWTNARRAEVQSKIFDRAGRLIATCAQGGYYVMKSDDDTGVEKHLVMEPSKPESKL